MSLLYIIQETLLMMGFTFVVGIAFAYVLKLMTLLFMACNRGQLASLLKGSRIWARAYRMHIARYYTDIRTATCGCPCCEAGPNGRGDAIRVMDKLAEYHFGNLDDTERKDAEMTCLYEMHHGKI